MLTILKNCIFCADSTDFSVNSLSEEVMFTPDNYQDDLCVTVEILDDTIYEELEYFAVSLSTNDSCVEFKEELIPVAIADDESECVGVACVVYGCGLCSVWSSYWLLVYCYVAIVNDHFTLLFETPPLVLAAVSLVWSENQYSVAESVGSVEVCVTAMGPNELDFPVVATLLPVPGDAAGLSDFNSVPVELSFSEIGEQCVNISIEMDGLLEGSEFFSIVLSSPDDRVLIAFNSIARVYIEDSNSEHAHIYPHSYI